MRARTEAAALIWAARSQYGFTSSVGVSYGDLELSAGSETGLTALCGHCGLLQVCIVLGLEPSHSLFKTVNQGFNSGMGGCWLTFITCVRRPMVPSAILMHVCP